MSSFTIEYATEYRYSRPVTEEHDVLRIKPAMTACQALESFEIEVKPASKPFTYQDYYGTEVIEFNIHEPHSSFKLTARSSVATLRQPYPSEENWEATRDDVYQTLGTEYLLWEREAPLEPGLAKLQQQVRQGTPLATLLGLNELIPDSFEYRPGITYVGSTVDDLLRARAGVCQDFVHLALLLLREQGIAARYVSGYLFVPDDNGGASAEVNTHAWLEALLPSPTGEPEWIGADPTNRLLVNENYVKVGHGRYYSDIPPIKGVYRGPSPPEVAAKVTMTRGA